MGTLYSALTGGSGYNGQTIDLTALGTNGWLAVKSSTGNGSGTLITEQKSALPSVFSSMSSGGWGPGNGSAGFVWSDGTPDSSGTTSTNSNPGAALAFSVPADTTVRRLRVYLGWMNGNNGQYVGASLSDSSASSLDIDVQGAGNAPYVDIAYAANSSGQTLNVTTGNGAVVFGAILLEGTAALVSPVAATTTIAASIFLPSGVTLTPTSAITGFSATLNGSAATIGAVTASGATANLPIIGNIPYVDTVLVSYDSGIGNLFDSNSNPIQSFSSVLAINNSPWVRSGDTVNVSAADLSSTDGDYQTWWAGQYFNYGYTANIGTAQNGFDGVSDGAGGINIDITTDSDRPAYRFQFIITDDNGDTGQNPNTFDVYQNTPATVGASSTLDITPVLTNTSALSYVENNGYTFNGVNLLDENFNLLDHYDDGSYDWPAATYVSLGAFNVKMNSDGTGLFVETPSSITDKIYYITGAYPGSGGGSPFIATFQTIAVNLDPSFASAATATNGTAIGVLCTVPGTPPVTGTATTGWMATVNGAARTISSISCTSHTFTLVLIHAVSRADTITVSYDGTGAAADSASNNLAAFSGESVTNDSTLLASQQIWPTY